MNNLDNLINRQLQLYPKHRSFLTRRFAQMDADERARCEHLADSIVQLAEGNIDEYLAGYEFICKIQRDEEIYFRRHSQYRLQRFADAFEQVYNNKPYMLSYMRGLLVTQIFWSNHTKSFGFYIDNFLGKLPRAAKLLEIGPGHGLLFARAIDKLDEGNAVGWDISQASLDDTARALVALGISKRCELRKRNLFDVGDEVFDAVVFSEVLEHLEFPRDAMRSIKRITSGKGRVYINVPINSPAPDHLFLLRSSEAAIEFVESCGFKVVDRALYPATNYTIEQAEKHKLTISVCMIAEPA